MMEQQNIARIVEVLDAEQLLDAGDAFFGGRRRAQFLIDRVMLLELEPRDHPIDHVIGVGRFLGGAGDNQRRARLVDQDRIDFIDDGEVMFALDVILQVELHVVAQVIEAELVVLAVSDIALIGGLALLIADAMHHHADGQAEEIVDPAHPFGVAPRQIIVDRDDVHAAAAERIEDRRQRRHQGLALAGLHLGNRPVMEHHAADQLNVEMALAERAPGRLAHDREDLRQDLLERVLAILAFLDRADAFLQFGDFAAQLVVAALRDLGFEFD